MEVRSSNRPGLQRVSWPQQAAKKSSTLIFVAGHTAGVIHSTGVIHDRASGGKSSHAKSKQGSEQLARSRAESARSS